MWYLAMSILIAIWVLVDGRKRRANGFGWAAWTAVLGPFLMPFYLAKRPLVEGETREGGVWWNILKNFALFWTLFMAVAAVVGLINVVGKSQPNMSEFEAAGRAIGTALGLGLIAVLWFFPFVGAMAIGFFVKKSSVIERGPTPSDNKGSFSIVGAIGVIVLGLITVGMLSAHFTRTSRTSFSTGTPPASEAEPEIKKATLVEWNWKNEEYSTYLVGTVRNNTAEELSYVSVEFNLYDKQDNQIGTASDVISGIDPYGTWRFKALVTEEDAHSARLKELNAH